MFCVSFIGHRIWSQAPSMIGILRCSVVEHCSHFSPQILSHLAHCWSNCRLLCQGRRPQWGVLDHIKIWSFSFDDHQREGDQCFTYPGHRTGLTRTERDHFRTPYCNHLWTLTPPFSFPSHILLWAPGRLTGWPPAARLPVFLVLRPRPLSPATSILSASTPAPPPPFLLLPSHLHLIVFLQSFRINSRWSRVWVAQGDGGE